MKRLVIGVLCLVLLGCGKSDKTEPQPAHTTVDGTWTYTTPDKGIEVEFDLKTSGATVEILNPTIKVGGTSGQAAAQITGVNLPTIDQIRINANDAGLVKPYLITFTTSAVSSNFNFMTVTSAEYTYPYGTTKTVQNLVILRK